MPPLSVPPGPPLSVANQLLQKQINDLTRNFTSTVEKKYSFCITNGY
jgi:hypothetical protein